MVSCPLLRAMLGALLVGTLGLAAVEVPGDSWKALRPPLRRTTAQGGPQQVSVYAITEDRAGRLWVGTQDGAAAHNGSSWTTQALPSESASQFIRAVAETADGSRWFGTEGGGLWRLKAGRWTQWRKGAGFPSNTVNFLAETVDAKGDWALWVATNGGGIARFQGEQWVFMDTRAGLPSDSVWKVRSLPDREGGQTLWAATTKGYARYAGDRWQAMGPGSGWPQQEANDIALVTLADGRRQYWLSLWGPGLLCGDGRTWRRYSPATSDFPSYFPISTQVTRGPDGQDLLWVATYDRGLAWLSNGQWRSLDVRQGLPANGIYSLHAPRRGSPTLWIGLRGGGLVSLDLHGWYQLDRQMGLPSNEVHAFGETRDAQGNVTLWVGTSEGLARWEKGQWRVEDPTQGLPHAHVTSLVVRNADQGTEVWAGTLKGLARRKGNSWQTLFKTQGLQDQRILSLLEVEEASGERVLWAGTEKGLLRQAGQQQRFLTPQDGLPAAQIFALAQTHDPDGEDSLWVGTRGSGIGRLKRGQWRRYGEAEGLVNLSTFTFREWRARDGSRWLWAGTFGGGAARLRLDGDGSRWETFTVANLPGLPSNVVVQIQCDSRGRVYLITQRGVARLKFDDPRDPARPTGVEAYGGGDGLSAVSTNYGASFIDHRDRLWVATHLGVAVLDPALEQLPAPLPPMVVDHVIVNGQARALGESGLELGYREKQLSFEMGLPGLFREEGLRFRTQILGFEPAPSPWSSNPRREFVALPDGAFVLRLEALDHLGRPSRPVEIPLRIRPAPWRSTWAYLGYALLLAGGVFLWHQIRTRLLRSRNLVLERRIAQATAELKEKAVDLERLNEEKSWFMGIAAHDLKNPLNAVLLLAQELEEENLDREQQVRSASRIVRATRQMSELIKDMLDINRLDAGGLAPDLQVQNLGDLAQDLCTQYLERARAKDIQLHCEARGVVLGLADPLLIHQVLDNLLSNALKFTPPGPPARSVWVRALEDAEGPRLEVQDQGPGFTEADKARAFGRFVRLSARPTQGEGSTGLGLSIVQGLVKAMGGELTLSSEPGRGACFTVHLKAGQDAEPSDS